MKKCVTLLVSVSVVCLINTSNATVWYVHPDSMLNSIQAGIDSCTTGDTVLVGAGTYIENINFNGMAITVIGEYGADTTIIDGSNPTHPDSGSVVVFNSGEDSSAVLAGFTIRNGSGTFYAGFGTLGGGILCALGSSPTVRDNIISNNTVTYGGGGILLGNSVAIIDSNTINYNEAGTAGGGIYFAAVAHPRISNNDIELNTAEWGGGLYVEADCNPEITNNNIRSNTAFQYGGGLGITWAAAPTLEENNIEYNTAHSGGGGILCGDESQPVITNCNIQYDTSYIAGSGGGILINTNSSPTIEKCTISYNSGVGVSCENCTTSIDSSTISYNSLHGIRCYNSAYAVINHCNIHGNAGYGVLNEYPTITINAEHNWWGDSTGPYHPTANPEGLGDSVSDYVDFDPWIGQTGIQEDIHLQPARVVLHISPNPFRHHTDIRYQITDNGIENNTVNASLRIYDACGRLIKDFRQLSVIDHQLSVKWDGTDQANRRLGSGVYFMTLQAGDYSATEKLLLIK
jgi:hypothetical protein